MPEHDPPRFERLALHMRAQAAEKAARDEAMRVIERWNAALAAGRALGMGRRLSWPRKRCEDFGLTS